MSTFNGKWKKIAVDNIEAFSDVVFPPDDQQSREEFTRLMNNLNNEEHLYFHNNKSNRKCYMDGKLIADINSTFGEKESKRDMFGDVTTELRIIGNHVIEKREVYTTYPEIVVTLTVDGDNMVVHKTALGRHGNATMTRRYVRLPENNI